MLFISQGEPQRRIEEPKLVVELFCWDVYEIILCWKKNGSTVKSSNITIQTWFSHVNKILTKYLKLISNEAWRNSRVYIEVDPINLPGMFINPLKIPQKSNLPKSITISIIDCRSSLPCRIISLNLRSDKISCLWLLRMQEIQIFESWLTHNFVWEQANRCDGRRNSYKLSFCAGADLENDPPTSSTKIGFTTEKQITPRVKLTRIDVIIKYQFCAHRDRKELKRLSLGKKENWG